MQQQEVLVPTGQLLLKHLSFQLAFRQHATCSKVSRPT
jgi:hypothetical protein